MAGNYLLPASFGGSMTNHAILRAKQRFHLDLDFKDMENIITKILDRDCMPLEKAGKHTKGRKKGSNTKRWYAVEYKGEIIKALYERKASVIITTAKPDSIIRERYVKYMERLNQPVNIIESNLAGIEIPTEGLIIDDPLKNGEPEPTPEQALEFVNKIIEKRQVQTKICPHCKQELPLENFCKNKYNKDGLQSRCKSCNRTYYKKYKALKIKETKAKEKPIISFLRMILRILRIKQV